MVKEQPQTISARDRESKGNKNIWQCKSISGCNRIQNFQKWSGTHKWINNNKRYSNTQTLDQGPEKVIDN